MRLPELRSLALIALTAYVALRPAPAPTKIDGDLVVTGKVTCREIRTTAGLIRFGGDDGVGTLDQTLFLQRKCGSRNEQSALVQEPAGAGNGALFLQIPGDQLPPGSISAQFQQYAPSRVGNLRRQRFSPGTVFVQRDGNPFVSVDTTLSGTGDPKGLRAMPVLFNVDALPMARLDGAGFIPKKP